MSSYEKQNFVRGQILKAEQLNHMEDGIEQLSEWEANDFINKEVIFTKTNSTNSGYKCEMTFAEAS